MKHLKTFEELSPSTYLSAANKLEREHPSRSRELRDWATKDLKDKVFTFMVSKKADIPMSPAYCIDRSTALEFKKVVSDYFKINLKTNSLYKESYGDDFFKVDTKFDGQYFVPVASQKGNDLGAKWKIRHILFNEDGKITAYISPYIDRQSEESSEPVEKTSTKAPSYWQKFKDKLPSWKESYM